MDTVEYMNRFLYDAATKGDLSFLEKITNGDESIDLASQKTPKDNNVLHIAAEFKQMNFFKQVKLHHPQSPRFWDTNKNNETPLHVAARVGCDEIVEFIIAHTRLHPEEGVDQGAGSIDVVENASTGEENRRVDVENDAVGEENGPGGDENGVVGEENEQADEEIEPAGEENGPAGEEIGATSVENGAVGEENGPAGEEIEPAGEENGATDVENGAAGEENEQADEKIKPASEENGATDVENGAVGEENGPGGDENGAVGEENEQADEENGPAGEENGATDVENGPAGEEKEQADEEIEPTGEEIEPVGVENGATDVENGAAGEEIEPAGEVNGAVGEENEQADKEIGPAGEEIEPAGEENGATDVENGAAGEENRPAVIEVEVEPFERLLRMTNLEVDTALHVAIRYGHDGVVKSLMEADPELCGFTNRLNESPLFLAVRSGSPSIIRYILDQPPAHVSFQGTNGMTALHAAVTRKHLNRKGIVKIMVSREPQLIRQADQLGWTPLHYAAFNGNLTAITQQLIEHEESACYMLDNLGMSALHVAAYAGHTKILKELIQRHPETCDLVNLKGQTALHVAVVGDQIGVIKYVLKTPKLARLINQADNDGNTPMHLAAICDNHRILRLLESDSRLDTTATNNGLLMVTDIFLDKIERTEITPRVMKRLGRPIPVGVTSFQQQIKDEFRIVVFPPEAEDNAATPAAITRSDRALKRPDTKLVVAGLIATATFTVAIHVPGGLKTDGRPVLEEIGYFKVFNFFNLFAFLFSILAIANECTPVTVLSTHLPTPASLIQYSLAGMLISFFTATSALQHKRHSETLHKYLFGTRVDSVLTIIGSIIVSLLVCIPISKTILKIKRRIIIRDLRNQVI